MHSIPSYISPKPGRPVHPPNENQRAFQSAKKNVHRLLKNLPDFTPVGIKSVTICLEGIQRNPDKIYTLSFIDSVYTALNKLDYQNPKFYSREYDEGVKAVIEEIKKAWAQMCKDINAQDTYMSR